MRNKKILITLAAIMIAVAVMITGCNKAKKPADDDVETDTPESNMPSVNITDDDEQDNDFSDENLYRDGAVDVMLTFEPDNNIPDAEWMYYAAEAVSESAALFASNGYEVPYAQLRDMKILNEGCVATLSNLVYTFTVDYAIYVIDRNDGTNTPEPKALDGATADEQGRLFLCVGSFYINGRQCEEYTFYREAAVNSTYGKDNPERFAQAASAALEKMKDKYADITVEFEDVINLALYDMYPTEGDENTLKCSNWTYTYSTSETDSSVIEMEAVICTVEYRLANNVIERLSVEYTHMDCSYSKTQRGYELITWYGYDASEEEKDKDLVAGCDSQAAALLSTDAEIIG
ncbi:MAG: hypothetical protein E7628_03510 [Ruminococcaceae bacterium]|nr:hypothetical protein [Oscillospiraceae bacterium]